MWRNSEGQIIDPFRPQIQMNGYVSEAELKSDQDIHFAAIRRAVENLSVLVFTLGLTEAWVDVRDHAVFPLAPGVVGGEYIENAFTFKNFSSLEIVEDLQWCIDFIRSKNSSAKFIFTVSPVALNATMENRHVFVSTAYSKSVLRVAAAEICAVNQYCDYFPSYEIITSPYVRGKYFGPDCRSVTEEGVNQHEDDQCGQ